MKNKNKRVKFLALLLFYLAIFFLSVPLFKQLAYITTISTMKYQTVDRLDSLAAIPFEAVQPLSMQEVLALNQPETPAIGFLSVSSIDLSVPIFPGISEVNMGYGAAAAYPERDPEKANIALLGHHLGYDQLLFGKINNVKLGDKIEMVYLGKAYSYSAVKKQIVSETEIQYMAATPAQSITLISCDQSDPQTDQRVVVVGRLEKVTKKPAEIKAIKAQQQLLVKQNRKIYWTRVSQLLTILLLVLVIGTVIICKLRL